MGDSGKVISYLKVDIEGSEIKAIPEWISSGVLDQVSQFGIELHTSSALGADPLPNLIELLESIKKLHQIGFKLISNVNNDCIGKSEDSEKRYINLMEAVFYKAAWTPVFSRMVKQGIPWVKKLKLEIILSQFNKLIIGKIVCLKKMNVMCIWNHQNSWFIRFKINLNTWTPLHVLSVLTITGLKAMQHNNCYLLKIKSFFHN